MMKPICCLLVGLSASTPAGSPAAEGAKPQPKSYVLRYQFQPGETLRWEVVHRSRTDTTISRKRQKAETYSKSTKVWRVLDVGPDGTATFEHMVEDVQMRHEMDGRKPVRYDSRTDEQPPLGFQQVAQSVGVPLVEVTISNRGKILKRQRKKANTARQAEGEMTIPLPEKPMSVGETWSVPEQIAVKLSTGGGKRIEARHRYTLRSVKTGVATIGVSTQILTPIHDPRIESQLLKHRSRGTLRFDVDAGRVLSQQMDLDKRVVGFHTDASTVHYLTRLTETLLPPIAKTAARPGDKRR